MLLSTPALRALKKNFSNAEISILTSKKAEETVKGLAYIDTIYMLYTNYGKGIPFSATFRNIFTLLKLRNRKFDMAANMRTLGSQKGAKKMKFLFSIIKPTLKIGRDTEGMGHFFDMKVPETQKGEKCEMEYDIDIIKALGGKVHDRNIDFIIGEEARCRVREILNREGVRRSEIIIGIHPGGMPSRRWPIENFAKAMNGIQKNIPCKFVITGGTDETGLFGRFSGRADTVNLVGKLNIKELGALIEMCKVYISNDTGPMHIAAVLKRPLVAIFGPGDITRYDPQNISDKAIVLYKKTDCAPCEKFSCESLKCLKEISPEEVVKAVLEIKDA